jgi:hypothetical protein
MIFNQKTSRPFVQPSAGSWHVVRCTGQPITIDMPTTAQKSATGYPVQHFLSGREPMPHGEAVFNALLDTAPTDMLLANNKAIVDALGADYLNKFYIVSLLGKKAMKGSSNQFNQWYVAELNFSEAELTAMRTAGIIGPVESGK